MSERNNGMSSELQEIMRRRLVKSEVNVVENVEEEDDEVSAITSKVESASHMNASIVPHEVSSKQDDETIHKETTSDFKSRISKFDGKESFYVRKNIEKFNKAVSPRPFPEEPTNIARILSPLSHMRFFKPMAVGDTKMDGSISNENVASAVELSSSEPTDGIETTSPTFADIKMKFHQKSLSSTTSNQFRNMTLKANPSDTVKALTVEQTYEAEMEHTFSTMGDIFPHSTSDNVKSQVKNVFVNHDKNMLWDDQEYSKVPEQMSEQKSQDKFPDADEIGFGDDPFFQASFPMFNQVEDASFAWKMNNFMDEPSASVGSKTFGKSSIHFDTGADDSSEIEMLDEGENLQPPSVHFSNYHICSGLDLDKGPSLITSNPINDNIILCRKLDRSWIIEEIGTRASNLGKSVMQYEINSTTFQCLDPSLIIPGVRGKIILGISDVLYLACCKIVEEGHIGLRITAIMEILLLGVSDPVTIGIVWKYGPMTCGNLVLELTYPSPERSFSELDFEDINLFIDEYVLLLIVSSNDTNSVVYAMNFINKKIWTTTIVPNNIRILDVAINSVSQLLAFLTSDGNVSIWTYEGVKSGEADVLIEQGEIKNSRLSSRDENPEATINSARGSNFSSIVWIPFDAGFRAGYGLLSISTGRGFSIYMMDLMIHDHYRELVNIATLCSQEALSSHLTCFKSADSDLPLLCASFRTQNEMLLYICRISLPSFNELNSDNAQAIHIDEVLRKPVALASHSISSKSTVYRGGSISSFMTYDSGQLNYHIPFRQDVSDDTPLSLSLHRSPSISSFGLGLNSEGIPNHPDDIVLYIQKYIHFDNRSNPMGPMSTPTFRYWLILSNVAEKNYIGAEESIHTSDEYSRTGALTRVVCEINCTDSFTSPCRIQRSYDAKYCMVFFSKIDQLRSSFFIIIDVSDGSTVVSLPGIDAAFIDCENNTSVIILNEDETISCYKLAVLVGLECSNASIKALPIFRRNSANMHKIRVNRVFYLYSGLLVVAASRKTDNKNCIFSELQVKSLDFSTMEFLIHDRTEKLWFKQDEEILNFCELSNQGSNNTIVALSTSQRVVIVSLGSKPRFLAQSFVILRSTQLVPIGSGCVGYISESNPNETRLMYLSRFECDLKQGIITSLPYTASFIIGIRQDRVVLGFDNVSYCVCDRDDYSFEFRRPITKPVLLLEPLASSGVSSNANVELLRRICENFGVKTLPNPHGEQEGIGTIGVGVSTKLRNILGPMYEEIFPNVEGDLCDSNKKMTLLRDITTRVGYHKNRLRPWPKTFQETKHVWFRGPFDSKENILLLDSIEEWLGKAQPSIIGIAGVEAIEDNGDQTLQNILAAARMTVSGDGNDDGSANQNTNEDLVGWIESVGTGNSDEENLVLYLRFSEGSEGGDWRVNGLKDLSNYNSIVTLVNSYGFDIRETSSNVDEGEIGKVRPLNDLVVERDMSRTEQFGLGVKVPRGSGLDVGMLHCSMNSSRQKATIEFWFRVPCTEFVNEVVLVRRSIFEDEDMSTSCVADQTSMMIWELVLVSSGHLEFRTHAGSLLSSNNGDSSEYLRDDIGIILLPRSDGNGGWNHVSVGFSCQNMPATYCNVTITLKGIIVAESTLKIVDVDIDNENDLQIHLDELLKESALLFGLGAMKDFRMTEIRAWCSNRSVDDIRLNMFEYLDLARSKRKFRVAIKNKAFAKPVKVGLLLPPRTHEKKRFMIDSPHDASHIRNRSDDESVHSEATFADFASILSTNDDFNHFGKDYLNKLDTALEKHLHIDHVFSSSDFSVVSNVYQLGNTLDGSKIMLTENNLLSEDIRRSATTALVRGPPATRHFGGNRGGLSHHVTGTTKAGSVCICGSEKTVIFSPTQSPSSRTYPIGASGAIISDVFQGSEYLCCFIAKEKRVVVFDLMNKFVVVELQMTTKLNFWRYLPTPSHSNSMRFILITPIGGFYWMPLEETPRPQQIWKRGDELASKKIVSYEEGGGNGLQGTDFRSTIGLILAVSDGILEAWSVSIFEGVSPLCLSQNVLGACLLLESQVLTDKYDPIVCIVSNSSDASKPRISLYTIRRDADERSFILGDSVADTFIDLHNEDTFNAPFMAMGDLPPVLCLSFYPYVIIIIRSQGLIFTLKYADGLLVSEGSISVHRYVVDATIERTESAGVIEVIALVHENDSDGRILKMTLL